MRVATFSGASRSARRTIKKRHKEWKTREIQCHVLSWGVMSEKTSDALSNSVIYYQCSVSTEVVQRMHRVLLGPSTSRPRVSSENM
jgi:hypothetical protein